MGKQKLVVVAGPTASGKTKLGVELAKAFSGEVISADSMQVYGGFSILSAKPDEGEQGGIPHHLLGFLDITNTFSVADFVSLAQQKIEEIAGRGHLPVVVGGTGLYIDALLKNFQFSEGESDSAYRQKLLAEAEKTGDPQAYLYGLLKEKDPVYAEKVHPNNALRVIRGLEVIHKTGRTVGAYREKVAKNEPLYDSLKIYLTFSHRETLYNRIDMRVDDMVTRGLVEEAREVFQNSQINLTAKAAIGYKEFIPYFLGQASLEEALETLKQNTRRYAKRQLTWFRRDSGANWLAVDILGDALLGEAKRLAEKFLREK